MDKVLRIVSTSDWHFGNKRVSSYAICLHIGMYIFPKLIDADLLIIGGDIFDMMLPFSDEHSNIIISFIIDLLKHCEKHNVIVRVLRGTFTHDRTQCSIFEILYRKGGYTNSLKYFDVMSCEYIKELDLRILYVPDDLPYKSSDACITAIYKLLDEMNWDKVDYVFGHGYFDHMLPPYASHKVKITFNVDQFKPIVKRGILMGHVHFCYQKEVDPEIGTWVIYNGSFERLAHNEEEPKGFICVTDDGKKTTIEFIENKHALKFITLDLSKLTAADETVEYYRSRLNELKNESEAYVRVIHPSNEIRNLLSRLTKQYYPHIHYTHEKSGSSKQVTIKIADILNYSDLPAPDPKNLPDMIYDFLNVNDRSPLSKDVIVKTLKEL